jgi:hypothetical protein
LWAWVQSNVAPSCDTRSTLKNRCLINLLLKMFNAMQTFICFINSPDFWAQYPLFDCSHQLSWCHTRKHQIDKEESRTQLLCQLFKIVIIKELLKYIFLPSTNSVHVDI